MSITTKKGDKGKTTLPNCNYCAKDEYIFEVLGEIDGLISWIGYPFVKIQRPLFKIVKMLAIQTSLNCDMARELKDLENYCEELTRLLNYANKYPTDFILPSTCEKARQLHYARVLTRKIERMLLKYRNQYQGKFSDYILQYMNRLSDYFYLAACKKEDEIIYVNGKK